MQIFKKEKKNKNYANLLRVKKDNFYTEKHLCLGDDTEEEEVDIKRELKKFTESMVNFAALLGKRPRKKNILAKFLEVSAKTLTPFSSFQIVPLY